MVNIKSSKENKLLGRKEMIIEVEYKGSIPSRNEIKNQIISKLGSSPDLTVIEKINSKYGVNKLEVEVKLYNSKELMLKHEPKYFLKRDGILKEEKKEGKNG